jgi:hypothetical protein
MTFEAHSMEIVLKPDLTRCIETAARDEFDRCERLLLSGDTSADLQARRELLRVFLESADFRALRRLSEPLLGQGRCVRFVVFRKEGAPAWRMDCGAARA